MIGHGHVGASDLRQIRVGANSTERILAPVGRDVWVRVSAHLAQQLGQGSGFFLAHKRSWAARSQRVEIIMEEKVLPLGAKQALYLRNENQAAAYIFVEFWGQEPPDEVRGG